MKQYKIFFYFLCLLCCSCYKNHLYVQQQRIGRTDLASTFVGSPDPRQCHPPTGKKMIVSWDFPTSLYVQKLQLKVTAVLWNHEQRIFVHPVDRRRGYVSYFFPNPQKELKKKLLTYRVDVLTNKGEIIETWKHHFWTEMITIDEENSRGE